jgi:type I restriction enzyme S subunit
MEVSPGYKQTDAGVIPEDWDVDTIASVTPRNVRNGIVDGPFGSNLKSIHYRNAGIPIVTSGYVTEGRFLAENYLFVEKQKFEEEKRSAVYPGDIVMAKIGARCGACAILPSDHPIGILSGNALKITVDESRHSTFYIWQVLWSLYSEGNIEKLRTVGAQPAVSMANLKKHKIALPPLPEQRAIATALSDLDALLARLDRLIAKKRDLRQAAMQQLLAGQTRLPGFSGEWEVVEFGDIATIRNVKVLASATAAGTQCVELESIGQASGRLLNSTDASGFLSKYSFKKGDVLFGRLRSYLRKYWLATFDGICSTEIWPLIACDARLYGGFLHLLVQTNEFVNAAGVSYGTHMPRSDWTVLKKFPVRLPPEAEQTAIAAVLSDMDAELSALEARRDKTRALKQAMMQELLTGKTRLIPAGGAHA